MRLGSEVLVLVESLLQYRKGLLDGKDLEDLRKDFIMITGSSPPKSLDPRQIMNQAQEIVCCYKNEFLELVGTFNIHNIETMMYEMKE